MDYSLLVGIHDCDLAAANGAGDQRNYSFDNDVDDQEIDEDVEDEVLLSYFCIVISSICH